MNAVTESRDNLLLTIDVNEKKKTKKRVDQDSEPSPRKENEPIPIKERVTRDMKQSESEKFPLIMIRMNHDDINDESNSNRGRHVSITSNTANRLPPPPIVARNNSNTNGRKRRERSPPHQASSDMRRLNRGNGYDRPANRPAVDSYIPSRGTTPIIIIIIIRYIFYWKLLIY